MFENSTEIGTYLYRVVHKNYPNKGIEIQGLQLIKETPLSYRVEDLDKEVWCNTFLVKKEDMKDMFLTLEGAREEIDRIKREFELSYTLANKRTV